MRRPQSKRHEQLGLNELFERYPDISIRPSDAGELVLAGNIDFRTSHPLCGEVTDSFALEVRVALSFPRTIPSVRETGGRIPAKFHRIDSGELCLGSPLRLRLLLERRPTLLGFVELCVLPYLVGFTVFQLTGKMPFGELEHGSRGLLDDYKSILGVTDDKSCKSLLGLAAMKKRIANKKVCPCGSGRRLGKCHHRTLNRLRRVASRWWFAQISADL